MGGFQMREDAVAHFGRGGEGEGDGEDLLGSVTASSVSSLRKRWMSRPVLPEPAGASTMKERRMSRAWARAAASGGAGGGAAGAREFSDREASEEEGHFSQARSSAAA